MAETTCTVRVNRGSYRGPIYQECGRPIERDGKCKMHLRVEERREQKLREWQEKYDRGAELVREAERLSRTLGFDVQADYSWSQSAYTGNFVVPGDWLRERAQEKAAA